MTRKRGKRKEERKKGLLLHDDTRCNTTQNVYFPGKKRARRVVRARAGGSVIANNHCPARTVDRGCTKTEYKSGTKKRSSGLMKGSVIGEHFRRVDTAVG